MYTLPILPYVYNALEPYIDELTMHVHYDKHHQAYVDNLNKALEAFPDLLEMNIEDLMKNLEHLDESIKSKVRNNGGGHANHSFFWQSMNPEKTNISDELVTAIKEAFESIEIFKNKFETAALGRFGSGWIWLVKDREGKLSIIDTPYQENPWMNVLADSIPILCLDVWEHAYYLKYQNKRADYVKAWWNVVNWAEVSKRYSE